MKKIYKSIITLEILSEEPLPDSMTLGDIINESDTGGYSLYMGGAILSSTLESLEAVAEIKKHGSDTEFFGLDKNGEELEEEY